MTHTEETMLALLAKKYGQTSGNGPAWAFIPKVRNAAAFDATRTIDAIAMSLWPSRGLELHGHEIKVSRGDWLRELKKPEKAEAFTRLMDRWWLVVSDASIVKEGELPPTWGLMVATGRGITVKVQAPELPATDAEWMPRTFLASLLRASVRTVEATPIEIEAAVNVARQEWDRRHAEQIDGWRDDRDRLRTTVREFEQASGIRLNSSGYGMSRNPAEVGAVVRMVLDGDAEADRYLRRLRNLAEQAESVAEDIRRNLGVQEAVA